jgi:hypothetical protein
VSCVEIPPEEKRYKLTLEVSESEKAAFVAYAVGMTNRLAALVKADVVKAYKPKLTEVEEQGELLMGAIVRALDPDLECDSAYVPNLLPSDFFLFFSGDGDEDEE